MKFLAVSGHRSEKELQAYLYSGNTVQDSGISRLGMNWAVVAITGESSFNAQYQADRLSSGMIAVTVHDTDYAAAIRLLDRL